MFSFFLFLGLVLGGCSPEVVEQTPREENIPPVADTGENEMNSNDDTAVVAVPTQYQGYWCWDQSCSDLDGNGRYLPGAGKLIPSDREDCFFVKEDPNLLVTFVTSTSAEITAEYLTEPILVEKKD